jgi:hypothetical protein
LAREHARIQTAIWLDDDFLDLTPNAQHLYLVLTTQMNLTFCGGANWHSGGVAQLAKGWTPVDVEMAAEELSEHLYIIIDEDTGEVLVRSFIRNDGLLASPNISKAMYRVFGDIGSRLIKHVIVHELNRIYNEQPLLKGWDVCGELLGKRSLDPAELTPFESKLNPSEPFREPFQDDHANPSHAPYSLLPTPNSHTPDSPQRSRYPSDFETVWALYPAKRDKKAAYKAYQKAIKEVSLEDLTAGVVRYRDDPNREAKFTKHFGTWLNAGSWDDEPLPDRNGKPMDHSARGLAKGMAMLQAYDAQQTTPFELEA